MRCLPAKRCAVLMRVCICRSVHALDYQGAFLQERSRKTDLSDFSLAKPTFRHRCISVDFESSTCAACLRNAALPQCASAYATTYMRWITGHLRERKTTFSCNEERLTISSSERNLRLPCTSLSGTAIRVWAHRFCDITNRYTHVSWAQEERDTPLGALRNDMCTRRHVYSVHFDVVHFVGSREIGSGGIVSCSQYSLRATDRKRCSIAY